MCEGVFSVDDPHSALHNIMQIELPALIHPPIDSALHGLELICRSCGSFFFSPWLPALLWTPQSALNGKRGKEKKNATAQRWLKDRYHFYNSAFPRQRYSGLMPPEGLEQFFYVLSKQHHFPLVLPSRLSWTFIMCDKALKNQRLYLNCISFCIFFPVQLNFQHLWFIT